MASYLPPTKSAEFIFYICLESQAAPGTFQANPTIAAGDFTVSTDGGAFSNLDTTPTVTPASGKAVKVTVSSDEMAGDNVLILWSDAAGAQWFSGFALIQPAAQSFDTMDTNIDSILADTGTDGVALSSAAIDAIHDEIIEGTLTARQLYRILLAEAAGKSSGGGTTTIAFRDLADAKDRISATVSATTGDRSAVTIDGS